MFKPQATWTTYSRRGLLRRVGETLRERSSRRKRSTSLLSYLRCRELCGLSLLKGPVAEDPGGPLVPSGGQGYQGSIHSA